MDFREGKTYNVQTNVGDQPMALKYFGDMQLVWVNETVHLFYTVEKSQLSDNLTYQEGDLIGLRDTDIVTAEEGRGRSGGFPY